MSSHLRCGRLGFLWACLAALCIVPPLAGETVLYNFAPPPKGFGPYGGVIRDSQGNLYGTALSGGSAGRGVVYKVDVAGHETVLHNFTGGTDGSNPSAGVIRDSAGNLYGTTTYGGSAGQGVVYKVDAAGHETVLYSFTGAADGGQPSAGVIRDSAGNLYGTTYFGGSAARGVVYELDATGHETVLYSFTGGADGRFPIAGVIRDSAGNLYGTTYYGGSGDEGVVYKVDTGGHETVLHSFTGGGDGLWPYAGVIRDSAGNLYGTTQGGGSGGGVVYKVDTTGRETVLYSFTGSGADGSLPCAGVIRDKTGSLYGTTFYGGNLSCNYGAGCGVVYKVDTTGRETVLYTFTNRTDGGQPYAGVIRDTAGNLYGTTFKGGTTGEGVVYRVDATGHETVFRSFTGRDGMQPNAVVIRDSAGNLFGTALWGGSADRGIVYKLDAAGHETVLHSFTGGVDGGCPCSSVIRDSAGNLYGTTQAGGSWGWGVVYKLNAAGHETVLYNFTGGADGGEPQAGVIRDSAGNLYGTTSVGFANQGVVYKVDTAGHETVLYAFTGGADGGTPYSGVISDSAGNLYGTTNTGGSAGAGVVYKVDTAGRETVLYTFKGGADGKEPVAGVIRDSAGNLYGTTPFGGSSGRGVVYQVDAAGHETVLYSFIASEGVPIAGVIRDKAGNLYGTTPYGGGSANAGVVYKVDAAGHETVLHNFTGGADGATPYAGVIRDSAGHLYGTTEFGGTKASGVVFRIP
jgi:uncharacterized repeat protein (TIGR03803 family)